MGHDFYGGGFWHGWVDVPNSPTNPGRIALAYPAPGEEYVFVFDDTAYMLQHTVSGNAGPWSPISNWSSDQQRNLRLYSAPAAATIANGQVWLFGVDISGTAFRNSCVDPFNCFTLGWNSVGTAGGGFYAITAFSNGDGHYSLGG